MPVEGAYPAELVKRYPEVEKIVNRAAPAQPVLPLT